MDSDLCYWWQVVNLHWFLWWNPLELVSGFGGERECIGCYPYTRQLWDPSNVWGGGFSISLSRWLFRMGIKELWSVTMVKCCRPPRNMWHLATAHAIVSSSNSMTTYRDSAEVKKWDPACINLHWLWSESCCRTNPSPCLLASVHRRVCLSRLKYAKKGTSVNFFFTS